MATEDQVAALNTALLAALQWSRGPKAAEDKADRAHHLCREAELQCSRSPKAAEDSSWRCPKGSDS